MSRSTAGIVGEARIPLDEWVRMRQAEREAELLIARTNKALRQVEVLLSFVAKDKVVYDAIAQFNAQSNLATIHILDGKVKIELKDEA